MRSIETSRSSLRRTLAASLLLVIAYVLGGIADGTVAREFSPHGSRPFADTATLHEKATRPLRLQWRLAQADAADEGSRAKSKPSPVAQAAAYFDVDWRDAASGATPDLTRVGPTYASLRTRNPRAPPGTLA
jgi:hypothetical protein